MPARQVPTLADAWKSPFRELDSFPVFPRRRTATTLPDPVVAAPEVDPAPHGGGAAAPHRGWC
jgi:hypothetical protein